jgi:ribosome-associated protein
MRFGDDIQMIVPKFHIPHSELEFSFVRSSGPGGQNVNKVNSKAVLHWNIYTSPSLLPQMRETLIQRLGAQISRDGYIVISSDRFRDQIRNREDCIEKFEKLIADASFQPKARKETKPSHSSKRKGKDAKSRQSEKKSLRKTFRHSD